MSTEQENAIIGKGRRITDEEIKAFFNKKHGPSSFEKESERIQNELYARMKSWFERTVSKFLDSEKGKVFLKTQEGKSPDEILKIMISRGNMDELYSAALKKEIDHLQGKVR